MGTGHSDFERLTGSDRRLRGDWLIWTVLGLAAVTAVAIVLLWPRDQPEVSTAEELGLASGVVTAEVESARDAACSFASDLSCHLVVFRLQDGRDAGTLTSQEFEISPSAPRFEEGEQVVLNVIPDAEPRFRYQYADRDRRGVLWMLAAAFALAVVGLGRLRGLAALAGLGASVLIIVAFIAPAILAGRNPVLVAAVGGSAIALLALYLAHGWRPLTHVAAIGTFASLALTLALSTGVVALARFSGFGTEEALFLTFVEGVQIRGLILAGAVLGAIGALDDVTVTQASTVFELRRLSPGTEATDLFRSGLAVGRDHIASTVNTLLLAYAGASLPLLLLFSLSELPLGFIANSEVVAVEIFRTLVGSIGLVASVPLTTWLAARVSSRAGGVSGGSGSA
ncbi:MAG: YibE/F family protein [Actinomycetota bacterium]